MLISELAVFAVYFTVDSANLPILGNVLAAPAYLYSNISRLRHCYKVYLHFLDLTLPTRSLQVNISHSRTSLRPSRPHHREQDAILMKNFSSLFIKSSRLRFFDRFERESTLNNSGILSIIVFESKPSSKKS